MERRGSPSHAAAMHLSTAKIRNLPARKCVAFDRTQANFPQRPWGEELSLPFCV
jgi:hypothetical protein